MKGYLSPNDWYYETLPSYKIVIETHSKILREARNNTLRIPEEILFALASGLTDRYEAGVITEEELKLAFTKGWNASLDEIVKDLTTQLKTAKEADDATWKAVGQTLLVTTAVTGAVLLAAAAARPAPVYQIHPVHVYQRPFNCTATRGFSQVYINCY